MADRDSPQRVGLQSADKKKFRDAIKLRYDWEITDTPILCACGVQFSVDHAMVWQHGGFIIQRHNGLGSRDAKDGL